MKFVVCTVGTSIVPSPCEARKKHQSNPMPWDGGTDDLAAAIDEKLRGMDLASVEALRIASAELNSLQRIGLESGDKIALMATDTADGRCCAEHLQRVITNTWPLPEKDIIVNRIPGLQVHDAEKLRKEGLPNLMREVMDYCRQYNNDSIILNPTAGFKGVVPFLTILGMMYRLRTVYVFESSDALISLPPFPISLDEDLLTRVLPALHHLQSEGAAPEEEYLNHIVDYRPEEYFLFRPFVEGDKEGFVTLSNVFEPILENFHSEDESLLLSSAARKTLDNAEGVNKQCLERLLAYLTIPPWRSMHIHRFEGTDLPVFKPGNVPHRAAGFLKGDKVYVARLYLKHDEYERELNGLSITKVGNEDYTPYTPKELHQAAADAAKEEKNELQELREENRKLKTELSKHREKQKESRKKQQHRKEHFDRMRKGGRKKSKKEQSKSKNQKTDNQNNQ